MWVSCPFPSNPYSDFTRIRWPLQWLSDQRDPYSDFWKFEKVAAHDVYKTLEVPPPRAHALPFSYFLPPPEVSTFTYNILFLIFSLLISSKVRGWNEKKEYKNFSKLWYKWSKWPKWHENKVYSSLSACTCVAYRQICVSDLERWTMKVDSHKKVLPS